MEQSQYDQIHRIAVLARELCKKRNHAAMELVNTSDAAWNNLFDLIGKLGNQLTGAANNRAFSRFSNVLF